MSGPTRRVVVGAVAGLALPRPSRAAPAPDGLHAAAARKGLAYGAAVPITRFRQDGRFRDLLTRECGILVCDNVMKMDVVVPQPAALAFGPADETVAFARGNRQRLRGHCLVWHEALPPWARETLRHGGAEGAEALMRRWIGAMARRYAGTVEAWDVVNEIVAPEDGRPDGLRRTPWLDALGPGYVDRAFRLLKEADPGAAAVWNDNACEQDVPWMEARRAAILRVLEGLLRRGVPIDRFGIQAHLFSTIPLGVDRLRRFLREIADLGLGIEITEFDIDDRAFPADIAARDRGVADFARRFLDAVLDEPAVLDVLTWDVYDPDTWLNEAPDRRRPDGLPQRALPFDAAYRRKPMWQAMHRAFADAPDHAAARARIGAARRA